MAENTEEKLPIRDADSNADIAEELSVAAQLPDIEKQSWGEKFKAKTYHFIRDVLINYIVNFMAAASFTYAFDVKFGERYAKWVNEKTSASKNPALLKFVIQFMTKTQLLLCGGHVLQPLLKWMKDNRKRLEFRIGHGLDLLQEMLGRGNTESKRSIEEYHRVSELVDIGDHNRKYRDAVPVQLNEADKGLLAKHKVDEELQFTDRKQSWVRVITARLTGVLCTTMLSIGLALTNSESNPPKVYDFRNKYEKPWGEWLGNKVIPRIPLMNWLFNNKQPMPISRAGTTGHQLIGEYFIDDAIYTAASKLGFDKMEQYIDKKEEAEEARKAEERRKVVEARKKSFVARQEEAQKTAPSMSQATP